jgi:CRISPR-associated protein Csm2
MEVKFWKDKAGRRLHEDLFSETAEKWAQEVSQAGDAKKNKPTQLRKFYDEVVRFDGIIKSAGLDKQNDEFNSILPYLKMLNAKVAYAEGRDLVTREFKDFIKKSLAEVHDIEDFNAFAGFFEAFMGFYKYYAEKEKPQQHYGRQQQHNQGFNRGGSR